MNLVDVIIPTYKPDSRFLTSIKRLLAQSVKPGKIIIINTDKTVWDKTGIEEKLKELFEESDTKLILEHIEKQDFDHGATRNFGVSKSKAEYFVCMTQDAVCFDKKTIEYLLRGMDKSIKMTYARQVPDKNANKIEKFTREFNYPDKDRVKTAEDIETMGIKAWFCSDVCAAYKKQIYEEAGGFVHPTVFNEDMLMAAKVMELGYKVVYKADARVVHYHEYSLWQQFSRNFALGASHREYREVFSKVSSYKEGGRLVKDTALHLLRKGKFYLLPKLVFHSGAKLIGYKFGKNYDRLPKKLVLKFCMNKDYFK